MTKTVTYLCMIVTNRLETMAENITAALSLVDEVIVVDGGSDDGTLQWLEEHPNIHVINFPWCDDFAASRNQYLNKIAELRSPDETSIYVRVDDDEFFTEPTLQQLKSLMYAAHERGADQICVRVRDVVLDREGNRISAEIGDFRKPLLHTWVEGMHYEGVVHESLVTPGGANQISLDDRDGLFLYEHRKREQVWWPRGLRNFFLAGGGVPPQADRQQLWLEFKSLIARHGDFKTYRDFEAYLSTGNIAQEIKDWFIQQRRLGLPSYDAKFTEIREGFLTYFIWYHPEELPRELIEQDMDYMDYVSEIERIHGEDAWSKIT